MSPAALNREMAAEYVGLSPNSFDEAVACGKMPKPRTYEPEIRRLVWLRSELEDSLNRLGTQSAKSRPYQGIQI